MPKHVYDFAEGRRDMGDLLGGAGANLAEMTVLGLPVPPGFTITTRACRVHLNTGAPPEELATEVSEHLHRLERATGRKLGQVDEPLLVTVRAGTADAIPDIGLNDDSVAGLADWSGDEWLAWDAYLRLLWVFGTRVLEVDRTHFADALREARHAKGIEDDGGLDTADLRSLTGRFKEIVLAWSGQEFPQDPREQLDLAITALFDSCLTEPVPECTAVTVYATVFGDLGGDSGAGVAFTRDPVSGAPGACGHYVPEARDADAVSGRDTLPLRRLALLHPEVHERLLDGMRTLEEHYRDLCEVEFTIERGTLWLLRAGPAERSAVAAFRVADALRAEGLIDADEALRRVTGAQLAELLRPRPAVDDLLGIVDRVLTHADRRARLSVRANADTVADARQARLLGATGIGLCRTEHMFLGDRRALALAEDDSSRAELLLLLREDFSQLLAEVAGQPITVRLLDVPPDETSGVVLAGLHDLQVRAVAEAAATLVRAGSRSQVEIMIPLVADARELAASATRARRVVAEVALDFGVAIPHEIGAMIELPRAALTAGQLAETAHSFSLDTDALTQTAWGVAHMALPVSPFTTIDRDGVGQLVAHAVVEGRAACPDLAIGACGELAGDPASIRFFHDMGLDYVSCAPVRVPVARLEAGRAAVGATR